MDWNDFTSTKVRIEYANLGKINKIRAWARRNGATCQVSRYARDAYEGYVRVPMPQGPDQQTAKIAEVKEIIK